jgi:hypothetical protein
MNKMRRQKASESNMTSNENAVPDKAVVDANWFRFGASQIARLHDLSGFEL